MPKITLHPKYMKVLDAYFSNDFNKEAALLAAGYSATTAASKTELVFGRDDVQKEISRRQRVLAKRHNLNQDWVISRLMKGAMADEILAKFKKVQPDGTLDWDFTGATEEDLSLVTELGVDAYVEGRGKNTRQVKKFKAKHADSHAALMALARHLGLFNDSLEIGGSVADTLVAARRRASPIPQPSNEDEDEATVH
jgi:phage terminase small subunit